jgi:pimeloyl-ACP methyl ester carboxylesterase
MWRCFAGICVGGHCRVGGEQGHGGYADVNGIRMYYETYGPEHGVPLVLLHGGGSTIDVTWGRILPFLARDRRVIAVEEQAHGRTTDRSAPVRFETIGRRRRRAIETA